MEALANLTAVPAVGATVVVGAPRFAGGTGLRGIAVPLMLGGSPAHSLAPELTLRPVLVEIVTDPNALSLPPKITSDQVFGFATAMSKIVLNGGAGEAVSMARSNLRNINALR